MRVLITGGAGFIGTHLRKHLEWAGNEVIVLDCKAPLAENTPASGLYFWANCQNRTALRKASQGCDFIFHLAATVGVKRVLADPAGCIENNIESLRAVLDLGIPGIFASTSEVYGQSYLADDPLELSNLPEERDLCYSQAPRWSYAMSKLIGEYLAKAKAWKSVRFFNVVGPGQNMAYGAVLPNFVSQAVAGKPITVYGDGLQVRSFLNVSDCCRILGELVDKTFDVVNVGSTNSTTIRGLAETVRKVTHSNSPLRYVPYAEAYPEGFEECYYRVPNLDRLHSIIGPFHYRSLEESISDLAATVRPQSKSEAITQ